MKKYDVVKDGVRIFTELADIYRDNINDTYKAEAFFKDFLVETQGVVNLDYLDADNDDRIEKVDFCHEEGIMRICTRVPEDDEKLRELRKNALPCDIYSLFVKLKNIRFVRLKSKECIGIVINGYTMNRKTVKKYASEGCQNVLEPSNNMSFFSSEILRKKEDLLEYMRAMTTPITSFWIIPKCLPISAEKSKHLLYHYNNGQLAKRLKTSISQLKNNVDVTYNQEEKEENVKMFGNRIRTLTEAFFKLVVCFYHGKVQIKKDEYNDRLLGTLINSLKKCIYKTEKDAKFLNFIVRITNELSHDTGLPVKMDDVELLCKYLQYYIEDFDVKIDAEPSSIIETDTELKPSNYDFIKENLARWNFSAEISAVKKTISGRCEFTIELYPNIHFSTLFQTTMDFLCNDGYVRTLSITDFSDALVLYCREEVVRLQEAIVKSVRDKCREAELDDEHVDISFLPHVRRIGYPDHLFTLDEIRTLMRKANDDENNKLVIDENGYARIIQNLSWGQLYPVSIETWGAGNNYVGASSSLEDAVPAYYLCLKLWLEYLETGCKQYGDYYEYVDEKLIVTKIQSLCKVPVEKTQQ